MVERGLAGPSIAGLSQERRHNCSFSAPKDLQSTGLLQIRHIEGQYDPKTRASAISPEIELPIASSELPILPRCKEHRRHTGPPIWSCAPDAARVWATKAPWLWCLQPSYGSYGNMKNGSETTTSDVSYSQFPMTHQCHTVIQLMCHDSRA